MENKDTPQTTNLWDFPKGKDILPEGSIFNMSCRDCKSENIELVPIDISWRNQLDNSDLGKEANKFFSKIPTLPQAIAQAAHMQKEIIVRCHECPDSFILREYIDRAKLTRWLHKKFGEELVL